MALARVWEDSTVISCLINWIYFTIGVPENLPDRDQ